MKRMIVAVVAGLALVCAAVAFGQRGIQHPPQADFTWSPQEPQPNQIVTFTETTTDPDGNCCSSFLWDFDNDGQFDDASGRKVTHAFPAVGDYPVSLRATDTTNLTGTVTKTVSVKGDPVPPPPPNQPPVAKLAPTGDVYQDIGRTFDASPSTDPDGQIIDYKWGFDGQRGNEEDTAGAPTVNHTFHDLGPHTVRVVVTDDQGGTAEATMNVNVVPPPKFGCLGSPTLTFWKLRATTTCFLKTTHEEQGKLGALVQVTRYRSTNSVELNGMQIVKAGPAIDIEVRALILHQVHGVPTSVKPVSIRVRSTGALVKVQGVTIVNGPIDWTINKAGQIDGVHLPQAGVTLHGLRVTGFSGTPQLLGGPGFTAQVPLYLAMPAEMGGQTFKKVLDTGALTAAGANCQFEFNLSHAKIGPVGVDELHACYKGANTFHLDVKLTLPPPLSYGFSGYIDIQNGHFLKGGVQVSDLNQDILAIIFLQDIGFDVSAPAPSYKVQDIQGNFTGSVGPKIAGADAYQLDGHLLLHINNGPIKFCASGDVSLAGRVNFAHGSFCIYGDGYMHLQAKTQAEFKPFFHAETHFFGELWGKKFNIGGGAQGCIDIIGVCRGFEAILSSKGAALCFQIWKWTPGVGILWSNIFPPTIYAQGCDIGDYAAKINHKTVARAMLFGAAADQVLDVKPGLPGTVFAVQGAAGPPSVTVTGPDGRTLSTPPDGGTALDVEKGLMIFHDGPTRTTYVVLNQPQAGQWKIHADPFSTPIVSIKQADGLNPPSIKTRVRKRQGKLRLEYRILNPVPDQTVTFLEQTPDDTADDPAGDRVPSGGQPIGVAHGVKGSIPFAPADGSRARKILAVVERGNFPARTLEVGHYIAPPIQKPGRPAKLRLVRRGSTLNVSWKPVGARSPFELRARFSDGRNEFIALKAGAHSARIGGVGSSLTGVVSVAPVLRTGFDGRAATAKLKKHARGRHKK